MVIDWSHTQMYNTLMSVSTGVALMMLARLGWLINKNRKVVFDGWAIGFAILGFILTLLGAHMTLTWTLAAVGFPFDNIIFGEPTLAFGVILLGGSFLLWKNRNTAMNAEGITHLYETVKPLSYFASAMGLGLIALAMAGINYTLFAAPPQEPITGTFAGHPQIEASFISGLYILTGIGAMLLPFSLGKNPITAKIIAYCWTIAGTLFFVFGDLNYFTHVGLVIHTMK